MGIFGLKKKANEEDMIAFLKYLKVVNRVQNTE